ACANKDFLPAAQGNLPRPLREVRSDVRAAYGRGKARQMPPNGEGCQNGACDQRQVTASAGRRAPHRLRSGHRWLSRDKTSQPTRQAAARPIMISVTGSAFSALRGVEAANIVWAATD